MRKMSKRRSVRVAVWAAASVVGAGAIGLLALPATAAVPTVTFDGGCGLLSTSPSSSPDKDSLSTQATSDGPAKVLVVNDLGTSATPFANGKAMTWSDGQKVVIGKGASLEVPFASGPVDLTLVPNCGGLLTLSNKTEATKVSVLAAPPASDPNDGTDPGSGSGGTGSGGSNSGSGTTGSQPNAGSRPDSIHDPVARGAVPPAGDGAEANDPSDDSGAVGAPADDNGTGGDSKNDAVGPMVRTNNTRGPGTTTLALIAAICLLGVGVAALRTIVVARAARASF